jgi:hypothetical protein
MAKSNSIDYYGSLTDVDSGIGLNLDYSSSNNFNSSTLTLIGSSSSTILSPRPLASIITSIDKRFNAAPLLNFAGEGVVERTRPTTMKNSENGDFILCQTNRGSYVAHRTPVIPQWIVRLVEEIESQQR